MKRTLWAGLIVAVTYSVQAQKINIFAEAHSESVVNIASEESNKKYVAPPAQFNRLKSAKSGKSEINVTYVDFPEEARQAFEYAVSIWEGLIASAVPVKILATWGDVEDNILALGRPATFYMNFESTPLADVYYPVALAEKLAGKDINPGQPDIFCNFSNTYPWYFGLDGNAPETRYDFVTAVLHEIAHGLGFSGFFKDNGEMGFFDNGNNLPSVYDYYIFNEGNQQLADQSVFFRPSIELHQQLTSEKLKFFQPAYADEINNPIGWVYAPPVWKDGESIYHLTTGNGLMGTFALKGQAIHNPGNEVLEILSELGWSSVSFDFDELKDFEEPCAELFVGVGVLSNIQLNNPVVSFVYSTDNFQTSDSITLQVERGTNRFSGEIPLDYYSGEVAYYLKLTTENGKIFKLPLSAPSKKFSLQIGPDYTPPTVAHNPEKIVNANAAGLHLSAVAKDNMGIQSVKVEYKLNGIFQEPCVLSLTEDDIYEGEIGLSNEILKTGTLEYRIVAEDKSNIGNKRILPSSGSYLVNIFNPSTPVTSYFTDFEYGAGDFVTADFSISRVAGFAGNILHTRHPYPVSAFENEKYDLMAQLKYPVILPENGVMRFDEVVLVEPGEEGVSYTDELFWDFVIVEGSRDNGLTWHPLTPGYDSGVSSDWTYLFESSTINNKSQAVGNQGMFLKKTIKLTEDTGFSPGDIVLFRFRLASDKSVSGWGWAIDNLEIKKSTTTNVDIIVQNNLKAYPNPFDDQIFIEYSGFDSMEKIDISVTNLAGIPVYSEEATDVSGEMKKVLELNSIAPGFYLLKISDGSSEVLSKKIIKR